MVICTSAVSPLFFHFSQISQGMSRSSETASYRWCVRIKALIKERDPINASDKADVAGWICPLPLNLQTSFASRHSRNKVLLFLLLAEKAYCKLLTLKLIYVLLADTSYRSGKENSAVWNILKELRMDALWKRNVCVVFQTVLEE